MIGADIVVGTRKQIEKLNLTGNKLTSLNGFLINPMITSKCQQLFYISKLQRNWGLKTNAEVEKAYF